MTIYPTTRDLGAVLLAWFGRRRRAAGSSTPVRPVPPVQPPAEARDDGGSYCDCERSHNGIGLAGRKCDCPAGKRLDIIA